MLERLRQPLERRLAAAELRAQLREPIGELVLRIRSAVIGALEARHRLLAPADRRVALAGSQSEARVVGVLARQLGESLARAAQLTLAEQRLGLPEPCEVLGPVELAGRTGLRAC